MFCVNEKQRIGGKDHLSVESVGFVESIESNESVESIEIFEVVI
jgi:hypothetical protein